MKAIKNFIDVILSEDKSLTLTQSIAAMVVWFIVCCVVYHLFN